MTQRRSSVTEPASPAPSTAQRARSQQLQSLIRQRIKQAGGWLRFDECMQQLLYAPAVGYYTAADHIFGRGGDFITAPEIAPLFSHCLGRFCAAILPNLSDAAAICEVGGGRGQMTLHLLRSLEALGCLPRRYYISEISAALREQQRRYLAEQAGHLVERVQWCEGVPDGFEGIVIANELLDALPVRRFEYRADHVMEQGVVLRDDRLVLEAQACSDPRLCERLATIQSQCHAPLSNGYVSEVNFTAEDWLGATAAGLQRGVLLLIDYGYPRGVYYHPQRHNGTLQCHYQHTVNYQPLNLPGLQDITAFVDFTALAEAGRGAGLQLAGFTTQAHFLLDLGILEMPGKYPTNDPVQQLALVNQIKRLTLPHEMGESFKVLALSKSMPQPLPGFGFRNRAMELE
ncbi:MAG: SAM-dependent methyltransferase [Gammaproteobacteria bacterium]|nr:SAM-dependent methyltransferase [Gammaproteobacteria bacterium]